MVLPDLRNRKDIAERLELARSDVEMNLARLAATREQIEADRERWGTSKSRREMLHDSAYARLLARFESQPVIEQAKGILIAESHCTADEAFDILRRASQRQNIRVRDLAEQIVTRASRKPPTKNPSNPPDPPR